MSFIEEISWKSKNCYSDRELLEYIDKHFDEIECELNGEVYEEPKKCDHNFCMDCTLRKTIDYQKSTLVCTNCGLCDNKKRSHTQLNSRKQVIAFQDRVITINIKEAQHPLK